MGSTEPTVSVIIPTYNCAPYVAAAVESALAQTYRPLEVIVVDDGSTDGTAAVLRPYAGRIVALRQANGGAAAARNAGIGRARGEVLAFLDADDLWLPGKLERQVSVLRRHPKVDLVFTDGCTFARDGDVHPSILGHLSQHFARVRPWLPGGGEAGQVVVRPGRPDLLFCNFIYTPGVVVRRACLDAVGSFDETLPTCEDYDLWLRIARRAPLALVNEVLFRCRLREAGSLGGPRALRAERFFENEWRVRERHLRWEDREVRRALRRVKGDAYLRNGWQELNAGRLGPAREAFWRSLRSAGPGDALLYLVATLLPGWVIRRLRKVGAPRPAVSGNG
jgi:glycosyltransferase involved in cell wall biosynthesis